MTVQEQIDVMNNQIKEYEEQLAEIMRKHEDKLRKLNAVQSTTNAPNNNSNIRQIKKNLKTNYLNAKSTTMKVLGVFSSNKAKTNKNARYGKAKAAYKAKLEREHSQEVANIKWPLDKLKEKKITIEHGIESMIEKGTMDKETVAKFKELGWYYSEPKYYDGKLTKSSIQKLGKTLNLPVTFDELVKADANAVGKDKGMRQAREDEDEDYLDAKEMLEHAGYMLYKFKFIWNDNYILPKDWPEEISGEQAIEWATELGLFNKEKVRAIRLLKKLGYVYGYETDTTPEFLHYVGDLPEGFPKFIEFDKIIDTANKLGTKTGGRRTRRARRSV
jgi:hypothetical protein